MERIQKETKIHRVKENQLSRELDPKTRGLIGLHRGIGLNILALGLEKCYFSICRGTGKGGKDTKGR